MTLVLDADVLIGALDREDPHFKQAATLFTGWHDSGERCLVSVVNLSEVLIAPASNAELLRTARAAILALAVTIHRPSERTGVDAARLRASHPISLADAYLLATARQADGSVVSFDRKVIRAALHESIRALTTT